MSSTSPDRRTEPSYFFVAVSTRENLDLCREYGLAGFPGSYNGAWTFADIDVGDYVSFVYGAKAYDLYRVTDMQAVTNAEGLPPWEPLELTRGGTYHFPFRAELRPERGLVESLVRPEFRYIAENLLLRGGYARTHFQADRTTLQQVSQMGTATEGGTTTRDWSQETTVPRWVRRRSGFDPPTENKFIEELLHVLVRERLEREGEMEWFAKSTGFEVLRDRDVEALGERALPEGHVDLLLKDAEPVGQSVQIPIELKLNRCSSEHLDQLRGYIEQLRPERPGGVLIAETIPRSFSPPDDIAVLRAGFGGLDMGEPRTFAEMAEALELTAVE